MVKKFKFLVRHTAILFCIYHCMHMMHCTEYISQILWLELWFECSLYPAGLKLVVIITVIGVARRDDWQNTMAKESRLSDFVRFFDFPFTQQKIWEVSEWLQLAVILPMWELSSRLGERFMFGSGLGSAFPLGNQKEVFAEGPPFWIGMAFFYILHNKLWWRLLMLGFNNNV